MAAISGRGSHADASAAPTIICAFNDRYLSLANVALFSLATHMKTARSVNVHLLQSGIPEQRQSALEERLEDVGLIVSWHDVPALMSSSQPLVGSLARMSPHYHRLLLDHVLPADTAKAIYLDVDVLVRADIDQLWRTELNDSLVGACVDYLPTFGTAVQNFQALGIAAEAKYFNTGVLLVNLDLWRAAGISRKVLDCTEQNSAYLNAQGKFHQYDQYGINVVLHDRWHELHERWNYGSEKPFADAAVVHFVGNGKPLSPTCTAQFRDMFFDYLERSGCSQEFHEKFSSRG